jgi:glycosyltransferase involved in cell wall biosynthesis
LKRDNTSNRNLTIAHFMPWSGVGGVEIATLRLTEATRDQFRHVAFCLPDAVALKDSFEKLGFETVTYTPPEFSLRHFGKYYKDSRRVARQIQDIDADIVHFSDEKAAYHNSFAAKLAGKRTVCHLRVSYPTLSWRQRLCLMPVQSFVFVSKEAMNTFCVPLPDSKKRVVYDAIEIPADDRSSNNEAVRREFKIPPGSPVVGMVARVSAQKDYFTLAAAASEILSKHPNTVFFIVGDNALVELNRQHFQKVLAELKQRHIVDNFIFTGHRSDVTRLMAPMDIAILCTHREGFPLCILEYMAMQKPVVATAVGGIPEIVIPDVTGLLHQHENSKELAAAILRLIDDPNLARRLAEAGYQQVKQEYSRKKYICDISKTYEDVMAR